MLCNKVDLGHGQFAFVCTRGQRHNCQFCSRYATKQCDFPVLNNGREKTCDAWMCDRCAVSKGPNVDWCPPHERNAKKIMEAHLGVAPEMPEPEGLDEERTVER
jgi:hypothetical protein